MPSTAFLVVLNGVLFFAMLSIGASFPFGVLFAAFTMLPFMLGSGLVQILVWLVFEWHRVLAPVPRTVLYLSPLWVVIILGMALPKPPPLPNQVSPSTSPSGLYEVSVRAQGGWEFHIRSTNDQKKWTVETAIMSHFSVYWVWDAQDRLWIYNSDSARVSFLRRTVDGWQTVTWGYSRTRDAEFTENLQPPEALYPE